MRKKIITGYITILLIPIFLFIPGCDNFSLVEILSSDLSIVPEEIVLKTDQDIQFSVEAGVYPYIFNIVSGGGLINTSTGEFTAPNTPDEIIISLEDSRQRIAEGWVYVINDFLSVSPENVTVPVSGSVISFLAADGLPPYIYSIRSPNIGSITNAGVYTPGSIEGEDVVIVEDSLGNSIEALVTLVSATVLIVNPSPAEVLAAGSVELIASNGISPYTFTTQSGFDGITQLLPQKATYTANGDIGTAIVAVTDSTPITPLTTTVAIYIIADYLTIVPNTALTLSVGNEFTFSAAGGNSSSYVFSVLTEDMGSGHIDSSTGQFTALAKDPNVTVIVTDGNGNTSTCRVKIKS